MMWLRCVLVIALTLIYGVCQAKTATIEYAFSDHANYTVIGWVAEGGSVDTANPIHGAIDTDADGSIDIGGIATGQSYCFALRAYHKTTGEASAWSNEVCQAVPVETIPSPIELPALPTLPGLTLDSVTFKVQ